MATTKTYPRLVRDAAKVVGDGAVISHAPSARNPLGQSGLHTLAIDVIDIVLNAHNEADAYKLLITYFRNGCLFESSGSRIIDLIRVDQKLDAIKLKKSERPNWPLRKCKDFVDIIYQMDDPSNNDPLYIESLLRISENIVVSNLEGWYS